MSEQPREPEPYRDHYAALAAYQRSERYGLVIPEDVPLPAVTDPNAIDESMDMP